MSVRRDKLSGSDQYGSAISPLAVYPILTTIHTIPDNETHTIWLTITNVLNVGDIECLGDIGEEEDSFNVRLGPETVTQYGPITLVGPTTLKFGATANEGSLKVAGTVERFRSKR